MRVFPFGLVAIGTSFVFATAQAHGRDYPFCIKGADYGSSVGDCSFSTYEQCKATASGRFDYCDANPYYTNNLAPQPRHGKRAVRQKQDHN
jgi:hypothetical protein